MFKKLVVSLFALTGLITAAFAADDLAETSVSVGISFPQIYNLKSSNDAIDSEKYSAWGINFAGRTVLSGPGFGLFLDGNVFFPYSHKITKKTSTGNIEYSYSMSGSTQWGIEGLVGIYGVLVSTDRFALPLGIGPHIAYIRTSHDSTPDITQSAISFGVGGWANLELAVSDSVTIYGGIRLDWDFWQRLTYKTKESKTLADGVTITAKKTTSGSVSNLFVIPAIGVVFRF